MNYELKKLFEIHKELNNSLYNMDDLKNALNEIYETFERYFGIKTEMNNWLIDENGLEIPHSKTETENFYFKIQKEIYEMLIEKEYCNLKNKETEYSKGIEVGKRQAFYSIKRFINEAIE